MYLIFNISIKVSNCISNTTAFRRFRKYNVSILKRMLACIVVFIALLVSPVLAQDNDKNNTEKNASENLEEHIENIQNLQATNKEEHNLSKDDAALLDFLSDNQIISKREISNKVNSRSSSRSSIDAYCKNVRSKFVDLEFVEKDDNGNYKFTESGYEEFFLSQEDKDNGMRPPCCKKKESKETE